jgi:hypothetical protein
MTRYHGTPEGRIAFTTEEEIARDAEELAVANAKPMEDWKASMQETDSSMPRYAEDILDGMDKSGVAQITLDRLQSKKDLRGERP